MGSMIRLVTNATAINKMPKILITDYTSELTDAPGEECNLKFEWQYASRDMASDLTLTNSGIFTEEYTPEFT